MHRMSNLPLSIFNFEVTVFLHMGRNERADQISFIGPFQSLILQFCEVMCRLSCLSLPD